MIHSTQQESKKWKPDGAAQKALEENDDVSEVRFTIAPKSQMHGFMTRADMAVEENRKAVKDGLEMARSFLEKYNAKT